MFRPRLLLSAALAMAAALAQTPNPTQRRVEENVSGAVYRVSVVEYAERTIHAVNYRVRSYATKIDFEGTPLLAKANGEAKVEARPGFVEIEVEFDDLTPASQFGPEYLTYVLWAVTPEGRANNLGEVLLNGTRGKLNVTTELQTFGMVVTAEPYFAVTQPSDVVVMENRLRSGTRGNIETVAAKYELLKRGSYTKDIGTPVPSSSKDDKTPLDLKEARNAITLARAAGADKYAAETFSKATYQLSEAERNPKKLNSREAIMAARGAVQTAEDSRLIALRRIDEERLAEERRLAQERTDKAKAEADAAAARALAEADARKAADLNAQRAAAQKAEADAARVAAERARAEAEVARREASREADRLAREREAADAARQRAIAAQQAAQQDADEARDLAAKAERDRMELRARLQQQLNVVLETKETARGLIVNMSDVLFDVGKATLKPDAREKLARVSGILSTHPDLKLQVEGHTDSTGGDEFNQKLSEERAASTRDYLVGLGITATSITAKGLGESQPVASNETAAGRQQNRRVELVISGESIQSQIH